ncbi:MAG: hypothetical protein AVDCRST_MAG33-1852 [uncultured Thermomicrobiales bacterium]|uniref:Uncharacterized protein n=1 Tax=uncultured Thermomicrobiales bacterium TaxID=1645740 RepID=A0A6J4UY52_9BACT|nr:MAG: hypothetical protein AVDCRST_MAG33-1852 [uncultured Thermomicrobiales bacterium]
MTGWPAGRSRRRDAIGQLRKGDLTETLANTRDQDEDAPGGVER